MRIICLQKIELKKKKVERACEILDDRGVEPTKRTKPQPPTVKYYSFIFQWNTASDCCIVALHIFAVVSEVHDNISNALPRIE